MKKLGLRIIALLALSCGFNALLANDYFEDPQMDFETRILIGSCYSKSADKNEIMTTIGKIASGDFEQWYQEWFSLAEETEKEAKEAESKDDFAYLRAATYFATSAVFIDGTDDPSRGVYALKRHLDCWKNFCSLKGAKEVSIKYEYTDMDNNKKETMMPGYLFCPENGSGPFPTIIFNNGSDASTSAMWGCGVYGALKRDYAALVFDGPGQNSMLWDREESIPFRYDWETVIKPIVDFLLEDKDCSKIVNSKRIILSGISQGGYWVLRTLVFEHRIAAGILDPGVMDVSTTWMKGLQPKMLKLLHGKTNTTKEKKFNDAIQKWLNANPKFKQNMLWRMKPYCTDSFYQAYKMVQKYKVRKNKINKITCPMFIADPEGEQFWPGQSQLVYDALPSEQKENSKIVNFTKAEGADGHCEPMARSLYDKCMFDWLDEVLKKLP